MISTTKPAWNPAALRRAMRAAGYSSSRDLANAMARAGIPLVAQNVDDWLSGHAPGGLSLIMLAEVLRVKDPKTFYRARPPRSRGRAPP